MSTGDPVMEQALKPEAQGNVAVEPVAWGLGDFRRARTALGKEDVSD